MQYEAIDRHQSLTDWINSEQEAFERNRAEKSRAFRSDHAVHDDFVAVDRDSNRRERPMFYSTAGNLQRNCTSRSKLESLG